MNYNRRLRIVDHKPSAHGTSNNFQIQNHISLKKKISPPNTATFERIFQKHNLGQADPLTPTRPQERESSATVRGEHRINRCVWRERRKNPPAVNALSINSNGNGRRTQRPLTDATCEERRSYAERKKKDFRTMPPGDWWRWPHLRGGPFWIPTEVDVRISNPNSAVNRCVCRESHHPYSHEHIFVYVYIFFSFNLSHLIWTLFVR